MKSIAIFGYSVMALEVMARLQQSLNKVVFVAQNANEATTVANLGYPTRMLDFRNDEQLEALGIGSTIDVIFCFYPNDSDNVFLTLSARALDVELTIIAMVESPDAAEKLLAAGANKIIDPYEICGQKTHEMLIRPDISTLLDHTVFGQQDLNLAQVEIPAGSYLANTHIRELNLNTSHNLLLIGVVDKELGEQIFFAIDGTEHHLDAGDILIVLGIASEIQAFKRDLLISVVN
ncbi:potassium channel family protein [Methylocucumis oryzae]|uniref:Potassium transporter TrkA n=1 Tax=Methylocucumis oryzae TaxID=1632867 RepID=A0A0F3IG32_9GAMM|nr:potassium channel protein [Methylocucumis oryzae]KJV05637.1 potassium transporter TrkA [Methylocucumis oryzae]